VIRTPSGARCALSLTLALTAAACDNPSPAGPSAVVRGAVGGPGTFQGVVLPRLVPVPAGPAATARITIEGGVIALPSAGLRVTFPAGAVTEPVDVTVRTASARRVAYEFEPHGLIFARPVLVEQVLSGTSAASDAGLRRALVATYVATGFDDRADGAVDADEVLPVRLDARGRVASFEVTHFSGYQLASGRKK
jgi:hypothetical protein